jgi:hypothetical protein
MVFIGHSTVLSKFNVIRIALVTIRKNRIIILIFDGFETLYVSPLAKDFTLKPYFTRKFPDKPKNQMIIDGY